jgi:PPOX class probable F420-dependent enzyme
LRGDRLASVVDDKPKRTTALKRLANVAANVAVEVVVDHYDDRDWSALWWVRVAGRARVVADGREHNAAVDDLVAKYEQYGDRRPAGPVLLVDVERITSWQASDHGG